MANSGERRREIALVAFIVLAAFLFRYWHITSTGWVTDEKTFYLGMLHKNHSPLHFSDADTYDKLAQGFIKNGSLDLPFNPPLTSFLLIAIYKMFGKNFFAAKLFYAMLGSVSLVFVYVTARLLFGRIAAAAASILCAASFTLIFIIGGLNIENVYLFTLSLSVCLFALLYTQTGMAGRRPYLFSFLFGLSAGCAALSRSEFLLILAAMFLFGFFKNGWSAKDKAVITVTVSLGIAVIITPWSARNYVYMKDFNERHPTANLPLFVPLSLNGPFNFVEGHNPTANGTYAPAFAGKLEDGYRVAMNPNDERHLAYLRDGYAIGWDYIKNNPVREIELLPAKLNVFLNGFANGFMLANFPAGLYGGSESMADSFVPDSKAALYAGIILFAAGFAVLIVRGGSPIRFLPSIVIGAALLVTVAYYGLSRLAYPVLPYYYMVISVGAVFIAERFFIMKRLPKWFASSVVALLIIAGFWQSRSFFVMHKKDIGPYGKFKLTPGSIIRWSNRFQSITADNWKFSSF
ncbi:MAG: ArnT family glycosyltransferase [Nitrospinota bacterium]